MHSDIYETWKDAKNLQVFVSCLESCRVSGPMILNILKIPKFEKYLFKI